jgi:hypothetical protein
MQKEDYQWVIVALGLLVIIALIIKPVATNEPPDFSLPNISMPNLSDLPPLPALPFAKSPVTTTLETKVPTPPVTAVPTMAAPTPEPTVSTPVPEQTVLVWNGTKQTVGFVDPSTYNVNLSTYIPRHNEFIPEFTNQSNQTQYRSMNYTSILKTPITGQWSGTTQVVDIPFPSWELWYTIEPTASDLSKQGEGSGSFVIQPIEGEGASASGVQGSYSTVKPTFTVDIMEAGNSSRIVRTVTPMGSIDPSLWIKNDPRPWKEKIFEGQKSYYFIIKAGFIKSYSLDIRVPNNYLGKI